MLASGPQDRSRAAEMTRGPIMIHRKALQDKAQFVAGDYRCVVLVDGEEIGGHDFRVG